MPPNDSPPDLPTDIRGDATRFDAKRARRAAKHPQRPGEQCRSAPGVYLPVIDRNRCEGKADCVAVCPYDVFDIGRITSEDKQGLSWIGRLKSFAHGGKTAYATRAADCLACGLCVVACPEAAITLQQIPKP